MRRWPSCILTAYWFAMGAGYVWFGIGHILRGNPVTGDALCIIGAANMFLAFCSLGEG